MNAIKNFNIEPFLVGGGRAKLNADVMMKLNILLPTFVEQEKIGSLFSLLDKTIALHQRKLDLLKEQKKGYLQKMFPKNGAKVPELRFAGFADDWEQRKLGDISYKVKEKNKTGEFTETLTNSAEYGIINQRDFFDKDISNAKNLTGYYVVKNDDFVYNPRISNFAPVGPIKRNKLGRTGVMSPLYYVFRTHDIDKNYFEKYFDTVYWHRFMELNGDSGARADRFAIKDSVFVEMPIPYPTMDEQQKIGSFFKQLDDTLAVHQRKLDLLKEQKKGYLQKMFPKNGAKVPELRFAGFADDWEERKLGQYTKLITKGTTPKDKTGIGDVNFVKVENITNGKIYPINKIKQNEHDNYLKRSRLEEKDILFSIAGTLGRTAIVNKSILPANTNQALAIIRGYDFDTNFLITSLAGNVVKEYIRRNPTVGAQPNLSLEQVGNLLVNTPNAEEQQKIGAFFKQLDETIALHQRKLDLLKEQKKGFLQKMFV